MGTHHLMLAVAPPPIKLRWYQEEAVEALFTFFNNVGGTGEDGIPVKANPIIALPTGTGKSIVIAEFIRRALFRHPSTRALMITHVKELIKQNAEKMQLVWPTAPLGIYSAGMKSKDHMQPIIFGGIKSMVGKFPIFGYRDFAVIDEAHLVGTEADTSYLKFINELTYGPDHDYTQPITSVDVQRALMSQNCNPWAKIILLTATPYRMGLGHLTNGEIATHVAYDLCNIEGFSRLMAEGYLCPLVPKRPRTEFDLSNVGMSKGDFNQVEAENVVNEDKLTYACLTELIEESHDRRCGLIFASGVKHAEAIGAMMNGLFGQECVVIHSKKTDAENDAALKAWKEGKVRWAVNMNSLTTGVDNPMIDIIAMMRGTMSCGLWVQMLGRGTRPYYAPGYDLEDFASRWAAIFAGGKRDCKVLDYAGNTRRLGPINDPVIPKMKGKGPPGDAPVRICSTCGTYNHASVRTCIVCGEEFDFSPNLNKTAGTDELLRSDLPQIETFQVTRAVYSPHVSKSSGKTSIKVSYYCGIRTFYEWVTVEGKAGQIKGRNWYRQRLGGEVPETDAEVLQLSQYFRTPREIQVWVNQRYPRVMGYTF